MVLSVFFLWHSISNYLFAFLDSHVPDVFHFHLEKHIRMAFKSVLKTKFRN